MLVTGSSFRTTQDATGIGLGTLARIMKADKDGNQAELPMLLNPYIILRADVMS